MLLLILVLTILILILVQKRSGYEPFNPVREPPKIIPDLLTPAECQCLLHRNGCPVMNRLLTTAAKLAGKPVENCEPPMILTNNEGGDEPACEQNDSCDEFKNLGGKRIGCLVVYLSNDFEGGELRFDAHGGRRIKPAAGTGVFYRPLLNNRGVHKGEPVTSGTKYTCVIFVRENHADKIEVL
jgi:hypothetical protein